MVRRQLVPAHVDLSVRAIREVLGDTGDGVASNGRRPGPEATKPASPPSMGDAGEVPSG
jgi:hypothetical protein